MKSRPSCRSDRRGDGVMVVGREGSGDEFP